MSNYLKLVGLVIGLAIIDIVLLSPKFLDVEIGGTALQTALGITILTASVIVLVYFIHNFFFKPVVYKTIIQLQSDEDYFQALTRYQDSKVLKGNITIILDQIVQLKKKKETLKKLLNDRFSPNELSYQRFNSVITEVEKVFYLNLRNVLNKLYVFDESEYKSIIEKDTTRYSRQVLEEKSQLYNSYLNFVTKSKDINDEIILNLEKLVVEISNLDSFELADIEKMDCMKEIDALIEQTKYYKH
ncbi:hypothetical protein J5Y03_15885 [Bacillus sp. RG28]|uniref:5-bromo-4-chloroindolyl phosphate hydrolysis protein n=1 Tax=Gottfriedia endophytica TaxID=2820819 RepID=A0A940NLG4_9BACI|nr:hypothetical protein [Gottfriedia endophytica]MBP0726640.1 hypothetical protein [Gottfriedia endophytica]